MKKSAASIPLRPGVDAVAFLAEIGERLFEILLTDYLAAEQTAIFNLLSMLNVIEVGESSRPRHSSAVMFGHASNGKRFPKSSTIRRRCLNGSTAGARRICAST